MAAEVLGLNADAKLTQKRLGRLLELRSLLQEAVRRQALINVLPQKQHARSVDGKVAGICRMMSNAARIIAHLRLRVFKCLRTKEFDAQLAAELENLNLELDSLYERLIALVSDIQRRCNAALYEYKAALAVASEDQMEVEFPIALRDKVLAFFATANLLPNYDASDNSLEEYIAGLEVNAQGEVGLTVSEKMYLDYLIPFTALSWRQERGAEYAFYHDRAALLKAIQSIVAPEPSAPDALPEDAIAFLRTEIYKSESYQRKFLQTMVAPFLPAEQRNVIHFIDLNGVENDLPLF